MPRIGWLSPGRKRTPRAARRATASGIRPSPQAFSIGGRRRSRTTTESPESRAPIATASPAGPPPTTARSAALSAIRPPSLLPPSGAGIGELGAGHGAGQAQGGDPLRGLELPGEIEADGFAAPQLGGGGARQGPRGEGHHPIDRKAGGAEDRPGRGLGQRRHLLDRRPPAALDEEGEDLPLSPLGEPARGDR